MAGRVAGRAGRSEQLPVVCILAGGRGRRLGELTAEVPKPLVSVAGKPFAVHQLELLHAHGARRIVLCVGYRAEMLKRAIGEGSRFGLEIRYSEDGPRPAGTAGAIRRALPLLDDAFAVLYGDTYLRIDFRDVVRTFRQSRLPALMTVLRNRGRWGRSNAVCANGRVVAYDKREPPPDAAWIDYGLSVYDRRVFEDDARDDLADVVRDLAAAGRLAAYRASRRFYEIGTPAGLAETDAFLRRRRVGSDT